MTSNNKDKYLAETLYVVSCFQIRNFVTSNNLKLCDTKEETLWVAFKFVTLWPQTTVFCRFCRKCRLWVAFKFVTLWPQTTLVSRITWLVVVSCFQIRNFVTSNNPVCLKNCHARLWVAFKFVTLWPQTTLKKQDKTAT